MTSSPNSTPWSVRYGASFAGVSATEEEPTGRVVPKAACRRAGHLEFWAGAGQGPARVPFRVPEPSGSAEPSLRSCCWLRPLRSEEQLYWVPHDAERRAPVRPGPYTIDTIPV